PALEAVERVEELLAGQRVDATAVIDDADGHPVAAAPADADLDLRAAGVGGGASRVVQQVRQDAIEEHGIGGRGRVALVDGGVDMDTRPPNAGGVDLGGHDLGEVDRFRLRLQHTG